MDSRVDDLVKIRKAKKKKLLIGKEVMKAGMAASLATTFLTGYRILRPMKFHPIAASAFLGFALAHILMSENRGGGGRRKEPR
ncbi:MAG: hypothetical protein HQL70_11225 [Magnetococcales bacterium]|nr:hypothetical protein [Magnetococcales bacterium]